MINNDDDKEILKVFKDIRMQLNTVIENVDILFGLIDKHEKRVNELEGNIDHLTTKFNRLVDEMVKNDTALSNMMTNNLVRENERLKIRMDKLEKELIKK